MNGCLYTKANGRFAPCPPEAGYSDTPTQMAKGFNFEEDAGDEWRWVLKDTNGEIVADSGEGYKAKRDCEHGARVFTNLGPDAPEHEVESRSGKARNPDWEYFPGEDGQWYWHFEAANGEITADGNEGYVSRSNVKRAIANVKDLLRSLQSDSGDGGIEKPKTSGPVGGGRFA